MSFLPFRFPSIGEKREFLVESEGRRPCAAVVQKSWLRLPLCGFLTERRLALRSTIHAAAWRVSVIAVTGASSARGCDWPDPTPSLIGSAASVGAAGDLRMRSAEIAAGSDAMAKLSVQVMAGSDFLPDGNVDPCNCSELQCTATELDSGTETTFPVVPLREVLSPTSSPTGPQNRAAKRQQQRRFRNAEGPRRQGAGARRLRPGSRP